MPTQQSLGQRQIFGMKRESLQKKVENFIQIHKMQQW